MKKDSPSSRNLDMLIQRRGEFAGKPRNGSSGPNKRNVSRFVVGDGNPMANARLDKWENGTVRPKSSPVQ